MDRITTHKGMRHVPRMAGILLMSYFIHPAAGAAQYPVVQEAARADSVASGTRTSPSMAQEQGGSTLVLPEWWTVTPGEFGQSFLLWPDYRYDVRIRGMSGMPEPEPFRSEAGKISGSVYGLAGNPALTGKDRVGSLGSMDHDYYDYRAGLHVGLPVIRNKLYFFSREEFTGRKDPTQYLIGREETEHILSETDARAIISAMGERYGDLFDPGTAGDYSVKSESQKLTNSLEWSLSPASRLRLENRMAFSKTGNLERNRQDFRFSSMAFTQKTKEIETTLGLSSRWGNGFSGDMTAGYTWFTDKRDPRSDPSLAQVQIVGRAPGTMIYLGSDREATIYDTEQKSWTLNGNLKWNTGVHQLLVGTRDERTSVDFAYINGWNGRIDYLGIDDFLANAPFQVRGSYHYTDNSREYILDHPVSFKVYSFSIYAQDRIRLTERLELTAGIRAEYTYLPDKPEMSDKVKTVWADPYFDNTYDYTPLNRISNDFLHKVQVSPRLDFRYDWLGDQSVVIRGGAGLFTETLPYSWLAYFYRQTGDEFGNFSQRADQQPFAAGTDPARPTDQGIADFIGRNGVVTTDPDNGKTEVFLADDDFVMPQFFRGSLGVEYTTVSDWKIGVEGMYSNTIKDVLFQQVNTQDNPFWYGYDVNHEQPVYRGTVDPRFTNIFLMSNTGKGYSFSVTGRISKQVADRWGVDGFYTFGKSRDVSPGVNSPMEWSRELNPSLVPNDPGLEYSNTDIRHRLVGEVSYHLHWKEWGRTNLSLDLRAQSGSPFTYGIVNRNIQGLAQQVSLAYIPRKDEAVWFFKDTETTTAQQQAAAFNGYIDSDSYLREHRGRFTRRNGGRTPWSFQADLHLSQDLFVHKNRLSYFTVELNVLNVTNLISADWGKSYFTSGSFNSTASVGLVPALTPGQQNPGSYPVFTFGDPGKPYSIDYFNSRARAQVGLRYTF